MSHVEIKFLSGRSITLDIHDEQVVAVVFDGWPSKGSQDEEILRKMREKIDVLLGDKPVEAEANKALAETLARPVTCLEISERPMNRLRRYRIDTLGELVGWSEEDLLTLDDFGPKSLGVVKVALARFGLALNGVRYTGITETWSSRL